MAWSTTSQIRSRVASVLGVGTPDDLPSHYDAAIQDGNDRGYEKVCELLIGRGYTQAQLDTWRARALWNKDAGVYFALEMLALDDDRAQNALQSLYQRLFGKDGLAAITLLDDAGAVIEVGAGTAGNRVSFGDCVNTYDVFTPRTADDEGSVL